MADPTSFVQPAQANTPTISTNPTILAANTSRAGFTVQNQGTNPLFILFGSAASATTAHVILQGGTALNDGKGGVYSQTSGMVYTGIITSFGTAPTYTVAEF